MALEELVFPSQRIICGKAIPFILLKKVQDWDFPGGPVVKTLPSCAGAAGLIPGRGAEIPHPPHGQKNQNMKQKQYHNKFSKDLKTGSHKKKIKSEKCESTRLVLVLFQKSRCLRLICQLIDTFRKKCIQKFWNRWLFDKLIYFLLFCC